ncbi:MAG: ABC transporter ATP-binding protein, partial [Lachnospiraceae bacterium]|nr:ABC transporter ATP-binding protein [Lachnospiraceae bacterium]
IPFVREYNASLCADREKDGKIYTIAAGFATLIELAQIFIPDNLTVVKTIITIIYVGLIITRMIYMIRVYLGLIEVFERKKSWIWMFVFLEAFTALLWGISPKFVPSKVVIRVKKSVLAKDFGQNITAPEEGLLINIKKRTVVDFFRKKTLIKDIHMFIPKGHMVLLLGGSGAGKTTFVNAVTGYEKAKAKIELDGRDIYHEYKKILYKIGFVPQQDLIRGTDTVQLTLSDSADLRIPKGVSSDVKKARVKKVLDEFGLTAVKNSLVDKLSGGQRKRLSIAMEYISDPTLFVLDEPDSGLDGVVARGLFERLRKIADEGKIVIVISHTPDRVIELFDDVIVLAKDETKTGRLAWYGPVNEAYEFFGKNSMEEILLSVNQKDEGGEGKADEFVGKYTDLMKEKVG